MSINGEDIDNKKLGIHVFGGGRGESIVIEMPTGGWGVVDCYASCASNPDMNPTLRFLKDRGVRRLEFLCLTHPHDDHFRGMSHLLNNAIEVGQFWRPAALTPQDLKRLVLVRRAKMVGRDEASAGELPSKDEFGRILKYVADKKIPVRPLGGIASIYPEKGIPIGATTSKRPFDISVIGPHYDRSNFYVEKLNECFDADGRFTDPENELPHNEISIGLLIRFGTTRVILGGDLEEKNWQQILKCCDPDHLAVDLVKVSHHGSRTGYTSDLWETFAGKCKPIAIIAPSSTHGLPKKDAVEHILSHTPNVYATSLDAIKYAKLRKIELPPGTTPTDVKELGSRGVRQMVRRNEESCGRCSVLLDNMGVALLDSPPPAGQLV